MQIEIEIPEDDENQKQKARRREFNFKCKGRRIHLQFIIIFKMDRMRNSKSIMEY